MTAIAAIDHPSLIHPLLMAIRPTKISWLVVAIVVDAIERTTCRARTKRFRNIKRERLETVCPRLMDSNSPSTVIVKRIIVGISASSLDIQPRSVERMRLYDADLWITANTDLGLIAASSTLARQVRIETAARI